MILVVLLALHIASVTQLCSSRLPSPSLPLPLALLGLLAWTFLDVTVIVAVSASALVWRNAAAITLTSCMKGDGPAGTGSQLEATTA